MTMTIVQIIEDEPLHAQFLDHTLRQARYRTNVATDGATGLADVMRLNPSVVLLDLMLPGLDGREVCRRIRNTPGTRHIPIIMISALSSEEDRIAGIEMGADDYVAKPFSPREVVSRVQAVLRRSGQSISSSTVISTDALMVQEFCFVVVLQQRQLTVSNIELSLLQFMMARLGELVPVAGFIAALGAAQRELSPEAVDKHLRTLHRKLENSEAGSIEILPGYRYRFSASPRPL